MPTAHIWSAESDATIVRMRGARASWDTISADLGVARWTAIERGRHIGARFAAPVATLEHITPDLEREPLPPGHPVTWGTITAGTCLDGLAYP